MYADQNWYKEVDLYNIICSALLMFSKEEAEIFNTILLICKKNNRISAKFLYENYGLKESIAKRLLTLLANDLDLLEEEQTENEPFYKLSKDLSNQKELLKQEKFYYQTTIQFNICLNPLLITTKQFKKEKIEYFEDTVIIINGLEKIDDIVKFYEETNHIYNISDTFSGLDLSKGIKINGKTRCKIKWINDQFVLSRNNYRINQISKQHPDHIKLRYELDLLISDIQQLKDRIYGEITILLGSFRFSIDFSEGLEDLTINIDEDDIENIGELYRTIKRVEGKTSSILVEKGWFYIIHIKLKISDKILNNWILLLDKLNSLIRKDNSDMLNRDISAFQSKIHLIIDDVNSEQSGTDFSPEIEDLQNVIKQVANYTNDGWFHLLYSKILEKEVVI